jgi:hypothetical protein
MKTSITIGPTKPSFCFPCFLRFSDPARSYGEVVFVDNCGYGTVIVSVDNDYPVGYTYPTSFASNCFPTWSVLSDFTLTVSSS